MKRGNSEKVKFRRTIAWKEFRLKMIEASNLTCECCGKKMTQTRHLQVHHLKPDEYDNLDSNNFAVLCHHCHEDVERLCKMKQETRDCMNQDYINIFKPFLT